MNDFKFFDFINNLEIDNSENIIEDIEYLVKKISTIEKKCKTHQDYVFRTFISKEEKNDEYQSNTCRDLTLYSELKAKENFKKSSNSNNTHSNGDKKPPDNQDEDISEPHDNLDPKLKKLLDKVYKKIAVRYHPDKNRTASKTIFESANKAHKSKNLCQLIYIMKVANVDISFSIDEMDFINNEKTKLEKKFTELKSSIFYKWDSLEQSVKDRYIDYLKQINGIK